MQRLRPFMLLTAGLALFCASLLGQRTSTSISGVVSDPSGAVVPGARVTVTEVSTGTNVTVQTNTTGFYVLSDLRPGSYRLHVDAAGFQGHEQTGITLQAGQPVTVNIPLQVGSANQEVTVSGAPPLVDTVNQTVSFAITPQFTEQIPLNGRNVLQLMSLAPDTSEHVGDNYSNQEATRPEASAGFVTASGEARENTTAFYLDGGLNEDTYTNVTNVFPNPDAVQEFTFETNSYNAKYGGRGGGIVNAVTRGGTNKLHGTAYEYLRNGALNARNYFASDHDTLNRNQFGFSLGGPLQRDKTFWFAAFQRTTYRYGTTANVAYGPTAAEMAGDWSEIEQQLYNPFTGDPFPNNQVPTSMYSPVSLNLLQLVPEPDPVDGHMSFFKRQMQNDNQWVARVDRYFGEKLRVSASYLWDSLDDPNMADQSNLLTGGPNRKWTSHHVSLNGSYRFGSNLLTTLTGTFSRALIRYKGSTLFPSLPDLGANYPVWDPPGVKEAGFYIDGWFDAQWLGIYDITRNQYNFINNWTYTRGSHTLDFGGELVLSQSIVDQAYSSSGYEGFWCGNTGYSPLDFMLGENCFFEQYAPSYVAPRGKSPALFVNDSWRLGKRFTLNLGLRWEPWLPWPDSSSNKIGSMIDLQAYQNGVHSTRYSNLPPGLLVRGDPGVPDGLAPANWKLFDPRIGFAWDVSGNGKTSLRAGFGIYHDQPFGRMYNQMMSTVPFTQGAVITDPTVSAYDPYAASPFNGTLPELVSPLPSDTVFPLPLSSAVGFAKGFDAPATMQWNLTLERQLVKGVMVRAAYEGSESYHMFDSLDVNVARFIPGESDEGNTDVRRPMYPDYGGTVIMDESTLTSSYNGLALSVEKRMTGNLSFLGGYRWAKCIDVGGSTATFAFNEFTDATNKRLDRGVCNSDIASQFKMAVIYRVPTFAQLGFAGKHMLGGWTMSGIWSQHDGFPFSVLASTDTNLDGTYYDRADLVGTPTLSGDRSTSEKLNEWFNTSAFQNPEPGNNGSSGRNILRGPGYANLDFSLIKSFPIPYGPLKEAQKIDFRAEFFNLFNHANFCNPNNGVGGARFGAIECAGDPRILQFTLKYSF